MKAKAPLTSELLEFSLAENIWILKLLHSTIKGCCKKTQFWIFIFVIYISFIKSDHHNFCVLAHNSGGTIGGRHINLMIQFEEAEILQK